MEKINLEKLISEAKICYNNKDFEREVEIWRLVCQSESENPYWKHNLAFALMNNGNLSESLNLFDELVQKYPKLSRAHNNRAILLVRMGADLQHLIPAFTMALTQSEDVPEFLRHFMNLCTATAYGLDSGANQVFDAIEGFLPQILEEVSPKKLLPKNKQVMIKMLQAYRDIAIYREAFARRQWHIAQMALKNAKLKFTELGLDNFDRGIDSKVIPYFELCRNVFGLLEESATNPRLSPELVLVRFKELLEEAISLREKSQDSAHLRILDVLGWFMVGMTEMLSFLTKPEGSYRSNHLPQTTIAQLSSSSFVDLGHDIVSLLNFVDRQCIGFVQALDHTASKDGLISYQNKIWTKIALYCNGLALDFRDIDAGLARNVLGWKIDPLGDAKREIQEFKSFVERQAYKDIFVEGKPQENIARALLQTFLTSRSYREVPVRGGQSDILQFTKHGWFLYETKIWRGPQYYLQGLKELEEYTLGEDDSSQLLGIFYIIFDATKIAKAILFKGGAFSVEMVVNRAVDVIVIHVAPPEPSRK